MIFLVYLLVAVFFLFAFVVFFGAPYLPAFGKDIDQAISLSNLKQGNVIADLGCGDGRVLLYLSKRKIRCVGYEINPILWFISFVRTMPYRKYARVKLKNFWEVDLSNYDGVFVFLIDHLMGKLEKKLDREMSKGAIAISYVFKLPTKKPTKATRSSFIYRF